MPPPLHSPNQEQLVKNRENRLVRAQSRIKAKGTFGTGEAQPTADEQLTRLEDDIRRLKIEFDIYFNGAAKRPPEAFAAIVRGES